MRIIELNKTFISEVEKAFNLLYQSDSETVNLCFANNNTNLKDSHKQVFFHTDLLNFVQAIEVYFHSKDDVSRFLEPKKDSIPFWEIARMGSKLSDPDLNYQTIKEIKRYFESENV